MATNRPWPGRRARRHGDVPRQQAGPNHVLVIVQNLPVPLDRRVWLECKALRDAGYRVTVICPQGPGDPRSETIEGITLLKYRPAPQAAGLVGYGREFVESWAKTAIRSVRVWRRDKFQVIQACNPPDTYWALAMLYQPFGVRFVFDQHDLNPELFISRFGEPQGAAARLQHKGLLWLERMTYRVADHVISTNESYRRIALERGRLADDQVTVVRSGPDTSRMRPAYVSPTVRSREHLIVYLGIMGPQDGVDLLLRVVGILVHDLEREDLHVALLGFGDCLDDLKKLASELGIADRVTFTGRADARVIAEYLSAADLGMCPDPKSPLNDVSTMNKTMEYMSYALPMVSFDLAETRVSAGDAAVYVPSGDVQQFAQSVASLLDDPDRRAGMARYARERVAQHLDWSPQSRAYVSVFDRLLQVGRADRAADWPHVDRRRGTRPPVDAWGNALVDLRRPEAVERFVRSRGETPSVQGQRSELA